MITVTAATPVPGGVATPPGRPVDGAKGHRCAGCPHPAASVLRVHDGSPVRRDVPVCEPHRDDAIAFMAQLMGRGSG